MIRRCEAILVSTALVIILIISSESFVSAGFAQTSGIQTNSPLRNFVTVNTTTNVYNPKQTVSIQGKASPFVQGTDVKLGILSPAGNEYLFNVTLVQGKFSGKWGYGFHLPANATEGSWLVMASYSGAMANCSFTVISLKILHTEVMENSSLISKEVNNTGLFPRLSSPGSGNFTLGGFANSTYAGKNETLQVFQGTSNGTSIVALGYNETLSNSVVEILSALNYNQTSGTFLNSMVVKLHPLNRVDSNLSDIFDLNYSSTYSVQLAGLSRGLSILSSEYQNSTEPNLRTLGKNYAILSRSVTSFAKLVPASIENLNVSESVSLTADDNVDCFYLSVGADVAVEIGFDVATGGVCALCGFFLGLEVDAAVEAVCTATYYVPTIYPSSTFDATSALSEFVDGAYDPANGNVYLSCYNPYCSYSLLVVNTRTLLVSNISLGGNPAGIAFDPNNNDLYVAFCCAPSTTSGGVVAVIDSATNKVLADITAGVGWTPWGMLYDPANGFIYVVNSANCQSKGCNSVSVIDPANNTAIALIPVGCDPIDAAYSPSNEAVYVTNYCSDTISEINSTTNTVDGNVTVSGYPISVAYDPSNGDLYATVFFGDFPLTSAVQVIDPTTNSVVNTVDVGNYLWGISYDPISENMYALQPWYSPQGCLQCWTGVAYVISSSTDNVVAQIQADNAGPGVTGVGGYPIFNPIDKYMWVPNYDGSISFLPNY